MDRKEINQFLDEAAEKFGYALYDTVNKTIDKIGTYEQCQKTLDFYAEEDKRMASMGIQKDIALRCEIVPVSTLHKNKVRSAMRTELELIFHL